jgi:hypothetical protein
VRGVVLIFCFSLSLSLSLSLLCPQSRNTILDLLRSKKSRLFCAFGFSLAVPRFRFPVDRSVKQKPLSIYRCIKPSEKERARDEITRKKEERDNDGDEQQQRRRRRRPSSTFFFTSTSSPSSPAPPRAPPPRALHPVPRRLRPRRQPRRPLPLSAPPPGLRRHKHGQLLQPHRLPSGVGLAPVCRGARGAAGRARRQRFLGVQQGTQRVRLRSDGLRGQGRDALGDQKGDRKDGEIGRREWK